MNRPIPKIVWQTWKTKDLNIPVRSSRDYMIRANPEYDFQLWDNAQCEDFMSRQIGGAVAKAYFALHPDLGAARADLWRYTVLYRYGGIYLDIDAALTQPLDNWIGQSDSIIIFEDHWREMKNADTIMLDFIDFPLEDPPVGFTENRIGQCFLIAAPKHPFIAEVIQRASHAINTRLDEINTMYQDELIDKSNPANIGLGHIIHNLTGPGIWTNSIRRVLNREQIQYRLISEDKVDSTTYFIAKGHDMGERNWVDYRGHICSAKCI